MKMRYLIVVLLAISSFDIAICQENSISEITTDIIKEREKILNQKENLKKILINNLPENVDSDSGEVHDNFIKSFSRRTYYLDSNNNVVYITTERDSNSPYPFHQFTKGKEEFFFKENKLINYRELVFYEIPYKGNPVSDSLINFDYIENYWFKDIVIEITEDSYYYKDEKCIKITKKEIKAPLIDFEKALKEAPEKELHPMIRNKPDLIGKSYVREANKLIEKLKEKTEK